MAEQLEIKRRNPDGVRFSEITAILQEEGFFETVVLPLDATFGQARGIAGRRHAQVMKRLSELGFVETRPGVNTPNVAGKATINCHVVIFMGVVFVYCEISIEMSTK